MEAIEHALQVFVGYLFIFGTFILGGYLLIRKKGALFISTLCIVCFILGFGLINHDRITEFNFFGSFLKFREVVKQAQIDAKTISDLRKRVEDQSATVDLVATSAKEAKALSEQAKKLSEETAAKNQEFNAVIIKAQEKQNELTNLTEISQLILKAQNDDAESYHKLGSLNNFDPEYHALIMNAVTNIRNKYALFDKTYIIPVNWKPGIEPENFSIQQFKQFYSQAPFSYHTDLVKYVSESQTISNKDKMQFFIDVMQNGKTNLRAVDFSARLFIALSKDTELKWDPFIIEPLIKWWEANKDKIK